MCCAASRCCASGANCRLTPQALADLCVARQLYSSTLMRIKQQRQLLVLQLAQLVTNTHNKPAAETYRTDAVFYGLSGEAVQDALAWGLVCMLLCWAHASDVTMRCSQLCIFYCAA